MIKGDQLWSSIWQCNGTSAPSAICCLPIAMGTTIVTYGRHSYHGGSQKLYRSIPRKLFLHPETAKEIETQNQWGKICTDDPPAERRIHQ